MRHLLSGVVVVLMTAGCGVQRTGEVNATPEAADSKTPPAVASTREVKLPVANSAKVHDTATANSVLLTVKRSGVVWLAPADREEDIETLENAAQVEGYLKRRIEAKKLTPKNDRHDANLVFRVDNDTPFGKLYPVLDASRLAGFKHVQLQTVRTPDATERPIPLMLPVYAGEGMDTIPDILAEQPKRYVVRVTVTASGTIAEVTFREEDIDNSPAKSLGVDLAAYRKKLQGLADAETKRIAAAAVKGVKIPLPILRLELADKLPHTSVVQFLETGMEAGFTNVWLVPIGWKSGYENEDPGLGPNIELPLPEIERVDKKSVDAALDKQFPQLSTAQPNVPLGTESSYANRIGATKAKLLKEFGGTDESERAVALGLEWLARQQKQDGAWEFDAGEKAERIAATGMALLPLLAAGETHLPGKKHQKTVVAGLNYLVKNCMAEGANKGKLSGNMYAHAIGTLALCEAYGMSKDKDLLAPAQAAINYIVKSQGPNGSWGYTPGNHGDTSIVGWQIQALKAARLARDIVVPDATFKKAIDFLNVVSAGDRRAAYGYSDDSNAAPGTSLTAVGLLSRYLIDGWGPDHTGMKDGVAGLVKRAPVKKENTTPEMYFHYYATQVVRNFGGEEWDTWNAGPKAADGTRSGGMRDWLVDIQNKKDGANQGSFDPDASWIGRSCGRLGTTAMCLLTLEVYYRHLPEHRKGDAREQPK
ncbi:MAG: hypothetical protein U0792_05565 [Gemmataceae bacterium]